MSLPRKRKAEDHEGLRGIKDMTVSAGHDPGSDPGSETECYKGHDGGDWGSGDTVTQNSAVRCYAP